MLRLYNYNSFIPWLYRIMDHRLFWFWQAFGDLVGYGSKPNPFTLFLIKIYFVLIPMFIPKKSCCDWFSVLSPSFFSAYMCLLRCKPLGRIWDHLVLHSKNHGKFRTCQDISGHPAWWCACVLATSRRLQPKARWLT